MRTDGLGVRARRLIGDWSAGTCVVGVVPESTDTDWSGQAALALAHAAAEKREPALILDLAPASSGLAPRFGAGSSRGFAETESGEASLLEVTRREDPAALYIPNGLQTAGVELAGSEAAETLADRVRDRDGVLLVVLDRHGLAAAASAGWLDGAVRLGEAPPSGDEPSGRGLPELGRLEPGPEARAAGRSRGAPAESRRSAARQAGGDPAPAKPDSVPPMVMADNRDPSGRWSRALRRALTAVAIVVLAGAAAVTVLDYLEGPRSEGAAGSRTARTASAAGAGAGDSASGAAAAGDFDPRPSAAGSRTEAGDDAAARSSGPPIPSRAGGAEDDAGSPRSADESGIAGAGDEDGGGSGTGTAQSGRDAPPAGSPGRGDTAAPDADSPGADLRRLSDTLVDSIRGFFLQRTRFTEDRADCRTLTTAYEAADRLFVQLSARYAEAQEELDPSARALYRERADDMEAVDRSFRNSGCRDQAR